MRCVALMFGLGLLISSAVAAEPLTQDQVGRFVSALEELVAESEEYGSLPESDREAAAAVMVERHQEIIEDHGFTGETWPRVAERVFTAWRHWRWTARRSMPNRPKPAPE